ncbi:MAG TPA: helix-turn-helix domain-containing protein [Trebonia sp.]|jgi:AcrR family transcriptional regulator
MDSKPRAVRTRAERKDARHNRELLIAAARRVFAAEGLGAPLDRIAAEAGVGSGTLYRHFPTRAELWEHVLAEPLGEQVRLLDEALADPDPWQGLAGYILASCAMEASSRGYLNLMTTSFEDAPGLHELRMRIQLRITKLVARARKHGAVRPDFTHQDLLFIALSNSRVIEVTQHVAPTAWRRNAELFLDSIRPERAHSLSEPPMSPQDIREITQRSRRPPRA